VASEGEIQQRFSQLELWLDERVRRLWGRRKARPGAVAYRGWHAPPGVSRRAIAVGLVEVQKKPDRSQWRHLPIRPKGAVLIDVNTSTWVGSATM
jgi:hypothetical protein